MDVSIAKMSIFFMPIFFIIVAILRWKEKLPFNLFHLIDIEMKLLNIKKVLVLTLHINSHIFIFTLLKI